MKRTILIGILIVIAIALSVLLANVYFTESITVGRIIPIPDTVSPSMRKLMARPLQVFTKPVPQTKEEWRKFTKTRNLVGKAQVTTLRLAYGVTIKEATMNGVNVYVVTPKSILAGYDDRVLINVHGGAYFLLGGESGLSEAILMAHHAKMKVIAVDYRMPPDYPFPAALEDALAVYQEVLKTHQPRHIGFFGTSAGGGLTAATLLKLRQLHLPFPGAIGLGTPWSDLSKTGDTYFTNENVDDIIVTYTGLAEAAAKLYAGTADLKDPLISPVYGDFTGFPPTIMVSGTRDLLLSCTVRVHRKLRDAGVPASLYVFEGMSHAFYLLLPDAPESKSAWKEMGQFFQTQLSS